MLQATEGLAYANGLPPPIDSCLPEKDFIVVHYLTWPRAEHPPGVSRLLPETAVSDVWVHAV